MEKGQVFSLDFLVSLAAVTLAIGLLFQAVEVRAYSQKEGEMRAELEMVAETAADLLVSNPEIVCELVDYEGSHISYLENCIPKINTSGSRISNTKMGIPDGYGCKLANSERGTLQTEDCLGAGQPLPDNVENIYSVKRNAALYNGTGSTEQKKQIKKEELEVCMGNTAGTCNLEQSEITLWVWRSPT